VLIYWSATKSFIRPDHAIARKQRQRAEEFQNHYL
jgi:hypothetical protein